MSETIGREPKLVDRVARDRGGDQERSDLDLYERHHPVRLDRPDYAREPVASRARSPGPVPRLVAAETFDL